jgi:hypothetical protein
MADAWKAQRGQIRPQDSATATTFYSIIPTIILGTIESGSNSSRDLLAVNAGLILVPLFALRRLGKEI